MSLETSPWIREWVEFRDDPKKEIGTTVKTIHWISTIRVVWPLLRRGGGVRPFTDDADSSASPLRYLEHELDS